MSDAFAEAVRSAPQLFAAHVTMTGLALLLGTVLGLPLAIVVQERRTPRWVVLGMAGVVQTIPSLALLALMVPVLGVFGFWPALVALVLYSLLPVLRNTVAGLDGLPREVMEAADAMGMTRLQRLRLVSLPLALPVVLAGVRTASAWVVGTATLSTPVGQPSLGNLIFAGLQTRNWSAVLVGCALAALLALALDGLLALLARSATSRSRLGATFAALGLAAIFVAGPLAAKPKAAAGSSGPALSARGDVLRVRPVVVGAKAFTEQYVLAELVTRCLAARGIAVADRPSLGSTVAFDALAAGDIGVYVDYSGTLWANAMKRRGAAPRWRVLVELAGWLAREKGVRLVGPLGFENAYAFAMRKDRAAALGVRTLADLARHGGTLRLGTDYEFPQRPEWTSVRLAYGLDFAEVRSFDPTFLYEAVSRGDVDVVTAFSSDGRIALADLSVLEDVVPALPPYDAVLLVTKALSDDREVEAALAPLVGAVTPEAMREANAMVDREADKRTPRDAAAWLAARARVCL